MYLSLPLPSTATRSMTVTVFYGDGSGLPMPFTVTVLKQGCCKDLNQALGVACCLSNDEYLLLAEVEITCACLSIVVCILRVLHYINIQFMLTFEGLISRFMNIGYIVTWKIHQNLWLQSRMMNILLPTGSPEGRRI